MSDMKTTHYGGGRQVGKTAEVLCPHCKGSGRYTSLSALGIPCVECKGTGTLTAAEVRAYRDRVAREMVQLPVNTRRRGPNRRR